MPSLVFCYAASDNEAARRLGGFLEASLPFDVAYDECVVDKIAKPGFDLVDASERALSAEAALILLSPDSVPAKWTREKWEAVFFEKRAEFHTRLGFVLLRECRFPELLRRERFFDLSRDFLDGAREIKRWLLRPNPQPHRNPLPAAHLEELRIWISDRPGIEADLSPETAADFIARCGADFEGVHRIDCRNRTRVGILGDIGYAAGVRLPAGIEENRLTLDRHCKEHRYLFLLENLRPEDRDLLSAIGKSSAILITSETCPVPPDNLAAAFFASPQDEIRCVALLGQASVRLEELLRSDFENGLRLGWAIVRVLNSGERFAETLETLDAMEGAARARGDVLALCKIEWEQLWLGRCEPDGRTCILAMAAMENTQLSLF